MWAGACAGELLERRGGLECSDLDYLRSALDEKRGALERQPTNHVRTRTHKLKPLNHFTVVPHPLSPLRFNTSGMWSLTAPQTLLLDAWHKKTAVNDRTCAESAAAHLLFRFFPFGTKDGGASVNASGTLTVPAPLAGKSASPPATTVGGATADSEGAPSWRPSCTRMTMAT